MNTQSKASSRANSEAVSDSRQFRKAKVVAEKFGVHPKTIHHWAALGHIKAFKLNQRVVLYDIEQVEAYVRSSIGDAA